jgi:hypothetical protein
MAHSALTAFAEQLEELVTANGFASISVGLNTKQADASRFDATLHFDDATTGNGCVIAHGPTIGSAINAAYRKSLTVRPNTAMAVVAEAA